MHEQIVIAINGRKFAMLYNDKLQYSDKNKNFQKLKLNLKLYLYIKFCSLIYAHD